MTRAAARSRLAGMLLGVSAAVFFAACDRAEQPDSAASPNSSRAAAQRIVCMSPAMTQILIDLDAGGRIVGVGAFDQVAPEHAAVVGHLRGLDYEKLLAVRPTDVVLQTTREGVPDRLADLAGRNGWRVWRWPLEDAASVRRAIVEPANDDSGVVSDSLSGMIGDAAAGRALVARIDLQLDAIAALTAGRERPRVLIVVRPEPVIMAAAPGTYIDELLTIAGGRNALTDSAVLYPELDTERVLALDPDVVLYLPPQDPPTPLALPDGINARVVTLNDRRALLPSSAMPTVAAGIAKLLHPDLADALDAVVNDAVPDTEPADG